MIMYFIFPIILAIVLVIILENRKDLVEFMKGSSEKRKEILKKLVESIRSKIMRFFKEDENKENVGKVVKKLDIQTIITIIGAIYIIISMLLLPLFDFASQSHYEIEIDYTASYLDEQTSFIREIHDTIANYFVFLLLINITMVILILTNRKKGAKVIAVLNVILLTIMYIVLNIQWCERTDYNWGVIPKIGYVVSFISAIVVIIALAIPNKKKSLKMSL